MKKTLRQQLRDQRKHMSPEEWQTKNQKLQENVREFLTKSSDIDHCLLFFGWENEPSLISNHFKQTFPKRIQLALPVIDPSNRTMEFYPWANEEDLQPNRYGIPEPKVSGIWPIAPSENTLIFVPALAFALNGLRLGLGKGYYDRYLHRYPHATTVGLAFEEFILAEVPTDAHDIAVQQIITDTRHIQVRG